MITRTGKISQLPKPIRDELNHRLQNGQQGPELLAWLNELPEVKELITTKFDHHPINRQNLTEWRHGGYQDWLQHQQREWRIQRVTEEGSDLEKRELKQDAFEHSARFALAELMADFDGLHQLEGHDRFQRLCALTRQLTRLQDSFNRSRWSALAWTRWNERFCGPANYDRKFRVAEKDAPPPQRPVSPNTADSPQIKPIQTNSTAGGTRPEEKEFNRRPWLIRNITHHKSCGCICKQCHPEGSNYPYQEALADHNESKQRGTLKIWRNLTTLYIRHFECNCPCPDHAPSPPRPTAESDNTATRNTEHETRNTQLPTIPQPLSPISPTSPRVPLAPPAPPYDSIAECLRRISLLQKRNPENQKANLPHTLQPST
jgi:hypothetical protein